MGRAARTVGEARFQGTSTSAQRVKDTLDAEAAVLKDQLAELEEQISKVKEARTTCQTAVEGGKVAIKGKEANLKEIQGKVG